MRFVTEDQVGKGERIAWRAHIDGDGDVRLQYKRSSDSERWVGILYISAKDGKVHRFSMRETSPLLSMTPFARINVADLQDSEGEEGE